MPLVITFLDPVTGNLAVMVPAETAPQGESQLDHVRRIAARDVPSGVAWEIVDAANFPADRTYRGAWKREGNGVKEDLAKAKEIHRANLLKQRDGKLLMMRDQVEVALDDGDNARVAHLRNKRKALRSLEAKIDADLAGIATVGALKNYRPLELDQ